MLFLQNSFLVSILVGRSVSDAAAAPKEPVFSGTIASFQTADCSGDPVGGWDKAFIFKPDASMDDTNCYDTTAWKGQYIGINWGPRTGSLYRHAIFYNSTKCDSDPDKRKHEAQWWAIRAKGWKHDKAAHMCFPAADYGGPYSGVTLHTFEIGQTGKTYASVDGSVL